MKWHSYAVLSFAGGLCCAVPASAEVYDLIQLQTADSSVVADFVVGTPLPLSTSFQVGSLVPNEGFVTVDGVSSRIIRPSLTNLFNDQEIASTGFTTSGGFAFAAPDFPKSTDFGFYRFPRLR